MAATAGAVSGGQSVRYNDLPEPCKTCQNLKVWGLDMGGNHLVGCKRGSWNFYTECDKYEPYHEEEADG